MSEISPATMAAHVARRRLDRAGVENVRAGVKAVTKFPPPNTTAAEENLLGYCHLLLDYIDRQTAWAALAAGALRSAVAANGRCPVCGLYVVGDEEDRGPESMHAPGCALHEALAAAPQP